jgi:hypothetical protein
VPLALEGTARVHAEAWRWGHGIILVHWRDDEEHYCSAWVPAANVRRMTTSEWDIIEYHQTPDALRPIGWGKRPPVFLHE